LLHFPGAGIRVLPQMVCGISSFRSPLLDQDMMRSMGNLPWLASVLSVPFSVVGHFIFCWNQSFQLRFRPDFGLKPNQHKKVKWQCIRF